MVAAPAADASRRRDDYALAAGSETTPRASEQIASGVGSVNWAAVPPGVFDAADGTVDWSDRNGRIDGCSGGSGGDERARCQESKCGSGLAPSAVAGVLERRRACDAATGRRGECAGDGSAGLEPRLVD